MTSQIRISLILLFFVLLATGCTPAISRSTRAQVAEDIGFKKVLGDPEAFEGKLVLWGGVIIGTKNQKEGTLIEVLQKPTNTEGKPKDVDYSDGRFLALYDGFLDAAIYSRGREVTVAGEVKGKKVLPLGEIEYTYPLISIKEVHLWPAKSKERFYGYPYPYAYPPYPYPPPFWYYPWWGYGPYRGYW